MLTVATKSICSTEYYSIDSVTDAKECLMQIVHLMIDNADLHWDVSENHKRHLTIPLNKSLEYVYNSILAIMDKEKGVYIYTTYTPDADYKKGLRKTFDVMLDTTPLLTARTTPFKQ